MTLPEEKKDDAAASVVGATATWNGHAMSQDDMMIKDTVITLDGNDRVVGSASKKDSHVFSASQPRGVLHRAFSVFLFEESTKSLLLQKRASTKITFPNVWTNTCCSHPLHGMEPPEVDGPDDVAKGTVPGAKNAAVRKLGHELGVPPDQIPVDGFKFLTRLHYWAADTVTHGEDSPWGEHEIDYVLFFTVPTRNALTVTPHPDEVDDVRWVTQTELLDMMKDDSLLFSPWFRLIARKWMLGDTGTWWADLKATMITDRFCDYGAVHRFDPPKEHMGGAGKAGPLFHKPTRRTTMALKGDVSKKQGAYGKIPTHSESKLSQLVRVDEVFSALVFLYVRPLRSNIESANNDRFDSADLAFCDDILGSVSRSFAAVIRQLPPELLVEVLVFYLVLRALDTIEDDMTAFAHDPSVKTHLLTTFHRTALVDPEWSMDGVGEGDERRLLNEFPKCHRVYAKLSARSRTVISDITHRMATGMAEFVAKDLGQGTEDLAQYDRYCHFVAGLVGEGLSRLFEASGLESPSLGKELYLADRMGVFLQKTNIIRDYLEDYVDGRAFWPRSVWSKHSKSGDLGWFADPANKEDALHCLNELVTDALEIVPDCISYLSLLRCPSILRFCAIPQVMAIATLEKCYDNHDVFMGVVKIRKGQACQLLSATRTSAEVRAVFRDYAGRLGRRAHAIGDGRAAQACAAISDAAHEDAADAARRRRRTLWTLALPVAAAAAAYGYGRSRR